jgi:DNA invertase Pin-like site-specific DNA recombinase
MEGDRYTALYIRESSKGQEGNWSQQRQESEGIAFATDLQKPFQIYKDIKSGKQAANRENWQRLRADIESDKIAVLWFYEYKRLGRNAEDSENIKRLLIKHCVKFYDGSKNRYLNIAEAGDKIATSLEGVLAEIENDNKSFYVTKALQQQQDSGDRRYSGAMFGYSCKAEVIVVGNKSKVRRTWYINECEGEIIRLIYKLAIDDKMSLSGIGRELYKLHLHTRSGTEWSHSKIRKILKHHQYAGLTTDSKGNLIESKAYPAIIERKQWETIQAKYPDYFTKRKAGRPFEHLGSGLLVCGICHSHYNWWNGWQEQICKDGVHRYNSFRYRHYLASSCGAQLNYKAEVIDAIALDAFYKGIFRKKEIINNLMQVTDTSELVMERDRLTKLLLKNKKTINALLSIVGDGIDLETIKPQVKLLQDENKSLENEVEGIKEEIHCKSVELVNAQEIFSTNTLREFERGDDKVKNSMIRKVISNIEVNKDNIKVHFIDDSVIDYSYKTYFAAIKRGAKIDGTEGRQTLTKSRNWEKKLKEELELSK